MKIYTQEELIEAQTALASLLRKCETAKTSLHPGTPQWTTLTRRMKAFALAASIIDEKLAQIKKGEE